MAFMKKVAFIIFGIICFVYGENKPKIAIFGGNGFIGSYVTELFTKEGYDVITINRNNTYFAQYEPDYQVEISRNFKCDRLYATFDCEELLNYIRSNEFDAVIDFTASATRILGETITFFDGRTKVFIFPSTDKVYDLLTPPGERGRVYKRKKSGYKESDITGKTRLMLPEDTFAHTKRNLELSLEKQRESLGFPYVIFRLGDVFGPRDSAFRIFKYMLWLEMAPTVGRPVTIPEDFEDALLSLVFVKDVANAMSFMVKNPQHWNEVYNLAYEPSIVLEGLMNKIANFMGLEPFTEVSDKGAVWMFPTLQSGYPNTSKIHDTGYTDTPLDEALEFTVRYYQKINHTEEFKPALQNLATQMLRSIFKKREFKAAQYFSDVYGLNMRKFLKWYKPKDEL